MPVPKRLARDHVRRRDRLLSIVRLARSAIVFNLAYFIRLRPELRKGSLVVVDRWIYNYLVQPYSVRYFGSKRLATVVCRHGVVRPRLIFALEAPPSVICSRTNELNELEVRDELRQIRVVMQGFDVHWLDASESPSALADRVMAEIKFA